MILSAGMIVFNELPMLRRLFDLATRGFDRIVAIDTGSTDGSIEFLRERGVMVDQHPWVDFSTARNQSIALAERCKADYYFMLDCDEGLITDQLAALKPLLDGTVYSFPRFEFIDDPQHINPVFYPDMHVRCWPLHRGIRYQGAIHEQPCDKEGLNLAPQSVKIPWMHIYHYGKLKPADEIAIKYKNYDRLAKGLPRDWTAVPGAPNSFSMGPVIPFFGPTVL